MLKTAFILKKKDELKTEQLLLVCHVWTFKEVNGLKKVTVQALKIKFRLQLCSCLSLITATTTRTTTNNPYYNITKKKRNCGTMCDKNLWSVSYLYLLKAFGVSVYVFKVFVSLYIAVTNSIHHNIYQSRGNKYEK